MTAGQHRESLPAVGRWPLCPVGWHPRPARYAVDQHRPTHSPSGRIPPAGRPLRVRLGRFYRPNPDVKPLPSDGF